MAKKAKRRPWSTTDVRTLKTAAKEDPGVEHCKNIETDRRRDSPKGFQPRAVPRFASLISAYSKSIRVKSSAKMAGLSHICIMGHGLRLCAVSAPSRLMLT
jgi:hypothetical protein